MDTLQDVAVVYVNRLLKSLKNHQDLGDQLSTQVILINCSSVTAILINVKTLDDVLLESQIKGITSIQKFVNNGCRVDDESFAVSTKLNNSSLNEATQNVCILGEGTSLKKVTILSEKRQHGN